VVCDSSKNAPKPPALLQFQYCFEHLNSVIRACLGFRYSDLGFLNGYVPNLVRGRTNHLACYVPVYDYNAGAYLPARTAHADASDFIHKMA
jgi:hypothetical protein